MKLTTEILDLQLRHTFTISRGSQDVSQVVGVRLSYNDVVGTGEACPSDYYHETPESIVQALERLKPWLADKSPLEYRHFLERAAEKLGPQRAALSALDLAVHDWFGRRLGQPLYRLFGLDLKRTPQTSFTIGIDRVEHMLEKIREAREFPVIKIKLGTPDDIEIVRALRQETNAVFRVDANCAWTAREAIDKSRELKALGVEFIEQPLPPESLTAMDEVYAKSALPLIADENSVVPEDIADLVGKFHGINIKLVKCGGLQPALRMVHLARTFGLKVMLGCMVDSSLGATAGAHIGPLMDYLDLDGPLLISDDPFRGLEYLQGRPLPLNRPGIGVERVR